MAMVRGVHARLDTFFEGLCKHLAHKPPVFIEDEGEVYFTGKRITETMDEAGQRWYHMDQ